MFDRDIHTATALVIDGNPTSRSIMAAQLRDLGVHQIRQMAKVQDARLVLEQSPHDIVLCEMNFDGAPMSGQDLLDELRREQLLPHSTVFMLVTGEASYAQVTEAAEATVDGYLVKPYSGQVLAERLAEVRRRKRSLQAIYQAIQARDFVRAAALAEARYRQREPYWSFAAQVAAELWLRADQPARALRICQAVAADKGPGWAKAGIARAQMAIGELAAARRQLESLVAEAPGYADAQDLLGRVLVEQGEFAPALEAFRVAAQLTPGCLLRLQGCGGLAFFEGCKDEAAQHLERAVNLGRKSKLFDPGCLLLLGLARLDLADGRGLAAVADQVNALQQARPEERRLLHIRRVLAGLTALQARRHDEALAVAQQLAAAVLESDFDLEAAASTIALWARLWTRLPGGELPAKAFDALLRQAGLRFCVSKASTEMLVAAAEGQAQAGETLRNCQAVIGNIAEQALNPSQAGRTPAAVELLLQQGEHTRNARLIDMAAALAHRHAGQLPDAQAVQARVQAMQQAWCAPPTHIAGVRRSARMPGGVALRT
ncbi:MAG: response regulator [Rubrivivax sp.]